MKRLIFLLLALALLASCAAAPAEPVQTWPSDETPAEREARIMATAETMDYEVDEEMLAPDSVDETWKRHVGYIRLLLTARHPERSAVFGGAFLDEQAGRYVVYTTEDVWNHSKLTQKKFLRSYYLSGMPVQLPIDIAICDFTLAELGATARELEALAPEGVLDIRVEPRQNRVAVYVDKTWDEEKQSELAAALAHPEHCAVTTAAPPDGSTVTFADDRKKSDGATFATKEAGYSTAYRAMERLYNAWWYLPTGAWQKPLCDQDPAGQYQNAYGRHANFSVSLQHDSWLPLLYLFRFDCSYTPGWDEWTQEHEAFFRHLLAGLDVTVVHYDEGYNANVV